MPDRRIVSFAVLLALAACAGERESPARGAAASRDSTGPPPSGAASDSGAPRRESLTVRPPERRPVYPPLARPLGVPPDSPGRPRGAERPPQ